MAPKKKDNLQLQTFIAKRNALERQVVRFKNHIVENLEDEVEFNRLESRLKVIENVLSEFNDVQLEIELLNPDDIDDDAREQFETYFINAVADAKKCLSAFVLKQAKQNALVVKNDESIQHIQIQNSDLELQKFNLPIFSGEFSKWFRFKNTFISLVENNPKFDKVQKFYRLLECLKGEAEKVLQVIEISDENYDMAWKMLVDRFEDKPGIIQNHLKALVDRPSVQRDSVQGLTSLLDDLNSHLRSLNSLGEPVDQWDRMLILILSRKLPIYTKRLWEDARVGKYKGIPTIDHFKTFIADRCKSLVAYEGGDRVKQGSQIQSTGRRDDRVVSHVVTNFEPKCRFCNGQHLIYFCSNLLELPIERRYEEVKKLKLCTNCLRLGHFVKECRSEGCKKCKSWHNTMLHHVDTKNVRFNQNLESNVNSGPSQRVNEVTALSANTNFSVNIDEDVTINCGTSLNGVSQILLSTAEILISDVKGNYHKVRCLLDSGSQSNFISERLFHKLGLPFTEINLPVVGVNKVKTSIKAKCNGKIKSINTDFISNSEFLILDKITSQVPNRSFQMQYINVPNNLKLADPNFNIRAEIDMLLGNELFFEILCVGQIKLGMGMPILQKTVLGWVVAGQLSVGSSAPEIICNLSTTCELSDSIENFWKLEEIFNDTNNERLSKEEMECEEHFLETYKRDESGRFEVMLPTRNNLKNLGESYFNAEKRLFSVEKKLLKNDLMKRKYYDFMEEYLALGHMTRIDDRLIERELNDFEKDRIFYLPHHGVVNKFSDTTSLRVVFDGSCRSSSGLSLNECLKVGPCIQSDIFTILCRFRTHNVVLTADIAKMYRMVNIEKSQRNLQRIIWRRDPSDKIEHFQLNTVTYGTGPASFLATRCLKQVANDIQSEFSDLSEIINKDFYVDDLLTGANSVEQARMLAWDISEKLAEYGFSLRKWNSNAKQALDKVSENKDSLGFLITDHDLSKTLGVFWNAQCDNFEYSINYLNLNVSHATKRSILAAIARVYDPLGLLSPVIIKLKIVMQHLWQLKIGWDDCVPKDVLNMWRDFESQLKFLNELKIPRQVTIPNYKTIELHGFSDASEKASGACVYVKSIDNDGNIFVKLLCAKSRVAPLKTVSLPRLELCGALLLSRIMQRVREAFIDLNVQTCYYTDSTIVLAWLAEEPNVWKTFVANRVSEIQKSTNVQNWKHISSSQNPADIVSRGTSPLLLGESNMWWNGPSFLIEPNLIDNPVIKTRDVPDRKKIKQISLVAQESEKNDFMLRYSSLRKLHRITAWCKRFCNNSRKIKENRTIGNLDVNELQESFLTLLRLVQSQVFFKEIEAINKGNRISNKSKLKSLDPFMDNDKILRVGGRLSKSQLEFDRKFPIVLPYRHYFTYLVIKHEHYRQLHAGPQAILAAVRQRFWPINGRRAIRSALAKCVLCFRANPVSLSQKVGDLPRDRTVGFRPFYVSGTDFAGPFLLKEGKPRSKVVLKAYMCIFVCFSTKAVHIELVSNLTSEAFLNALKRFVACRGLVKKLYSDNGSNYIGAYNVLNDKSRFIKGINTDTKFISFYNDNDIEWSFIPPRSPHQGGIWEGVIKSAKYHVTRIVGNTLLTFEEMSTIFTQIESILNSRPLTEISSNPNDFFPLTPGHFLIGAPLTSIPELNVQEVPDNRLSRYELLQKLQQHFWTRWSREYLSNLQSRSKWNQVHHNVKIGTLVILKEENLAPLQWRMGRITELHPGKDGIVRVVTLRTSTGTFKRAVQKLCVLPIEQ